MEIRTLIIIAIIVVLLIVAYIFIVSHRSTAQSTTSTSGPINGTTSMTVPPYITTYNSVSNSKNITNLTGLNVKTIYTGPAESGGLPCNGISRAYFIDTVGKFHADSNFSFYFEISSPSCNFTITSINIDNPGFRIVSEQPPVPYYMPSFSNIEEVVTLTSPVGNFTGPVSVTINAK